MEPYIEVIDAEGSLIGRFTRSGPDDPESSMSEYNAHLALRELWSFGRPEDGPPMVKPLKVRNPPDLRSLFFTVYWYYQLAQQGGTPLDLDGTGEERLADHYFRR
jgi:hypothetical protein